MMRSVSAETQLNASERNVAGKGGIGDIRDTTEIGNRDPRVAGRKF